MVRLSPQWCVYFCGRRSHFDVDGSADAHGAALCYDSANLPLNHQKESPPVKKDLGTVQAVFPMPVLVIAAYDENGTVQCMNAAWGQI